MTEPDPYDPDHRDFRDDAEGTDDNGTPTPSVDGSELLPGGE
jgi:hypothetical protein